MILFFTGHVRLSCYLSSELCLDGLGSQRATNSEETKKERTNQEQSSSQFYGRIFNLYVSDQS